MNCDLRIANYELRFGIGRGRGKRRREGGMNPSRRAATYL
jgi:hypothetical protein